MANLEISKLLTLSTGHVSEGTARLLDKIAIANKTTINQPMVYNKASYGWFIHVADYFATMNIP